MAVRPIATKTRLEMLAAINGFGRAVRFSALTKQDQKIIFDCIALGWATRDFIGHTWLTKQGADLVETWEQKKRERS